MIPNNNINSTVKMIQLKSYMSTEMIHALKNLAIGATITDLYLHDFNMPQVYSSCDNGRLLVKYRRSDGTEGLFSVGTGDTGLCWAKCNKCKIMDKYRMGSYFLFDHSKTTEILVLLFLRAILLRNCP